jgi:3-dehydroquinate synthase
MKHSYESRIVFGPLPGAAAEIEPARTVIVTDPEVRRLHGASFPPCRVIEVPRGEAAKNLAALEALYGSFLELGLDRGSTVLAVGGGSITDLSGFAASTWMRGIDFGFAPTTLLSMIDASIGGKNGIDFRGYKNLVGNFNKPRFIRFDVSLLSTLSDPDFASGMSEVAKHAILEGDAHFRFIERNAESRAGLLPADLEELVRKSVEFKAAIAARDEREAGERMKLNLGHTIGHAVEAATGLTHGQAVAAGLGSALRLSVSRYGGDPEMESRVLAWLGGWGLPTTIAGAAAAAKAAGRAVEDGPAFRERVAEALGADKKRKGDDLHFVLPMAMGRIRVLPITVDALRDFVRAAP